MKSSADFCNWPVRDHGNRIIAVTLATCLIAVVVVGFRILGRLTQRERRLRLDDYAIILTTVCVKHHVEKARTQADFTRSFHLSWEYSWFRVSKYHDMFLDLVGDIPL